MSGSKLELVNMVDSAAFEAFRNRHSNLDLFLSTWYSQALDPSAQRNYDLCFHINASDIETARVRSLEAAYYIMENFGIPEECMEITYNSGGKVSNNAAGDNNDFTEKAGDTAHNPGQAGPLPDYNNLETGIGADDNDDFGQNIGNTSLTDVANQHSPASSSSNPGGQRSSGNAKENATAAEIIISIPLDVFGGQPAPLMPAMNYHLARQMTEDGINNLDIDVYQRDHFVRLPNSINSTTDRYVIPLTMKELLYLEGKAIAELTRKPESENSLIISRPVPEAVEWYAETLAEFKNMQSWQDNLRKTVWDNGWEVPLCIRHILRLCLYDHNRLEAYRTISSFFAWIKAGAGEIRHLIYTIDRRNPINNYGKMNAIITFAVENPWFVECKHPLLQQFCPAGKCFMAEVIKEYEQPRLFGKNKG